MRQKRFTRLVTVGALGAVLLGACGSTSSGSSAAGGSASGRVSPGVDVATKTITIGATGPLTGPDAAFGLGTLAAEAEIAAVNASGGVNGWKIKYDVLNDQYQPSLALSEARQLVSQDNIFALVGELGTPNGLATIPFCLSNNLPDIGFSEETGALAANSSWLSSDLLYGFQIPYGNIAAWDVSYLAQQQHATSFALAYQDDAVGTAVNPGMQYGAKQNHIKLAADVPVPDSATDFSGYAATLKASGAPWVFAWLPPPELSGLIKTAASIGYTPHWMAPFFDPIPSVFSVLGSSLSNGLYFESWLDAIPTSSGVQQFNSAVAKYEPKASGSGAVGELGWIGAGEFIYALQKATAGGKTPTRQAVINALDNGQPFTPGNLGFTLKYSGTSRIPSGSDSVYKYENGSLVKVYGPTTVPSIPSSQLK